MILDTVRYGGIILSALLGFVTVSHCVRTRRVEREDVVIIIFLALVVSFSF